MSDWDDFQQDVPWFAPDRSMVDVGPTTAAGALLAISSSAFTSTYPTLAELLSRARLTPVKTRLRRGKVRAYHLLSWPRQDGSRFGWLCPVRPAEIPQHIHSDHALLLHTFGGIDERFNEPEGSWLLNLNEALTAEAAAEPVDQARIEEYAEPNDGQGDRAAVEFSELYPIAIEANGNTTFCHRTTGGVLLFAPDHSFDHVRPLDGWPEYTFYRIPAAPSFRDWVEVVARQWSKCLRDDPSD